MKDLDFDELDRAVNSLVGTPTAAGSPGATPPAASTEVPVTSTPAAPVTASPSPLAERRTSGRFMDVVHPSSDMRTSTPLVATTPVSRSGATITPVTTVTLTPMPTVPVTPPVVTASAPADESKMPDPIDFHPFTPGALPSAAPVATPPVADDEDGDIAKIADDINASLNKDTTAPLESPFLSDAKVEKRPLGAFSTDTPPPAPEPASLASVSIPDESTPASSADTAPKPEDHPIEKDTPLPAELQSNLLSIEANEDAAVSTPAAQFTPPAAPSTDVPTGPTSIPQQYSEQPSTGDKPAGTIFDTEAYKKPVIHSKKKKSGWMIVLWIFLLLVVGGGIGAAVYFFVLPML